MLLNNIADPQGLHDDDAQFGAMHRVERAPFFITTDEILVFIIGEAMCESQSLAKTNITCTMEAQRRCGSMSSHAISFPQRTRSSALDGGGSNLPSERGIVQERGAPWTALCIRCIVRSSTSIPSTHLPQSPLPSRASSTRRLLCGQALPWPSFGNC